MLLFAALTAILALPPAQAAGTFSLADLERLLAARPTKSMEEALPLLPPEFRRNPVLMAHSRSLQSGSPDAPRAILSNDDGSFVLAFGRGGDSFEMVQFHRDTRRFEFAEVAFDRKSPAKVEHDLMRCSGCHGNSNDSHPVFESFPKWPGAYGESGERLEATVEAPALAAFLKAAKTDSRYGALVDLDRTHGTLDSAGRLAGRPNSAFVRKMMRLNFERIADRIVNSPKYEAARYRLLAAYTCTAEATFKDDFLAGLGNVPSRLLPIDRDAKQYEPEEAIAFYWILPKLGYDPFDWSLAFGDMYGDQGARLPEPDADYGTSAEELARAFAASDPRIAALVGRDGRTKPSCAKLRDLDRASR
ncbi:MAG: hypothetical protein JST04_05150 [Bdellovibrionales bacterium]|nr:hypothetical protein [Bdellovibrionales bacterium]